MVLQANKNFIKLIKNLNIENNFNYFFEKLTFLNEGKFLKLTPFSLFNPSVFKLICESIFNTEIAKIDRNIIFYTFLKIIASGKGLSYLLPKENWGRSFIEPLVKQIEKQSSIHYNRSVKKIVFKDNTADQILFSDGSIVDCKNANVILATPPYSASKIIDKNIFPQEYSPIINIHFVTLDKVEPQILGITNSIVDWIFCKENIISTTKSAATNYLDISHEDLIKHSWQIISKSLKIEKYISAKILIEKRATFTCTKENLKRRPKNDIGYTNLFICGDYTNTKLPATIEGAIISGMNSIKASS